MSAGELIPCRGIVGAEWQPVNQQAAPETLAGESDVLELGPSYWVVDFEVECPTREDFDTWSAFLARRSGAAVTFTAPRTFRKLPRDPLILSDSGVSLPVVNSSGGTITLSGVGTGKAYAGDMVSYRTANNGYYIGQVQYDATPSGGSITLSVWPEPMAKHATTPSPRRIEALGEFRLDGAPRWSGEWRRRGVRFTAKQVIR